MLTKCVMVFGMWTEKVLHVETVEDVWFKLTKKFHNQKRKHTMDRKEGKMQHRNRCDLKEEKRKTRW